MRFNRRGSSQRDWMGELNRHVDGMIEKVLGLQEENQKKAIRYSLYALLALMFIAFVPGGVAIVVFIVSLARSSAKKTGEKKQEDSWNPGLGQSADQGGEARRGTEVSQRKAPAAPQRRDPAPAKKRSREREEFTVMPRDEIARQLTQLENFYKDGFMEKEEYLERRRRIQSGRR